MTDLTDFIAYLDRRLKAEQAVPACCRQDGAIYTLEEMIQELKEMSND